MRYGVKMIHTHTVGDEDRRFYEELILGVEAQSFDEAYEKAERYMENSICDYTNIYGQRVKTLRIEAVDCFLAFDPEEDVQELFSRFTVNNTSLPETEYYRLLREGCTEEDLRPLRNIEFSD